MKTQVTLKSFDTLSFEHVAATSHPHPRPEPKPDLALHGSVRADRLVFVEASTEERDRATRRFPPSGEVTVKPLRLGRWLLVSPPQPCRGSE